MIRIFTLIALLALTGCMSQQPVPAVDRSASARSASAQPVGPGYYTVKRGDTLYQIARENGQDFRDIVIWNGIQNPSAIKEGQVLRVAPPTPVGVPNGESVVANPISTGALVEARPLDQPATTASGVSDGVKREPRAGKEPYSDEAYARLNNKAGDAKPEVKTESTPALPAPTTPAGPDDLAWNWPTSSKLTVPYSESGNKGLDFAGKAGDPVLAAGDGKVVYAGRGLRGFGELVIIKHNSTYLSAYAHNRKIMVKEGQMVNKGQKIAEMGNTDTDSVKLHFEIRKQGKPVDPAQYLPKR